MSVFKEEMYQFFELGNHLEDTPENREKLLKILNILPETKKYDIPEGRKFESFIIFEQDGPKQSGILLEVVWNRKNKDFRLSHRNVYRIKETRWVDERWYK